MKRPKKVILLAAAFIACGEGDRNSPVDVGPSTPTPDAVALVPTTLHVSPEFVLLDGAGDTATVSAEVGDQDGSVVDSATVAWATADSSVATIDASGLVSANAVGVSLVEAHSGILVDSIPVIVTTDGVDGVSYVLGDTLLGALTATAEVDTIPVVLLEGDEFQVYLRSSADHGVALRCGNGRLSIE